MQPITVWNKFKTTAGGWCLCVFTFCKNMKNMNYWMSQLRCERTGKKYFTMKNAFEFLHSNEWIRTLYKSVGTFLSLLHLLQIGPFQWCLELFGWCREITSPKATSVRTERMTETPFHFRLAVVALWMSWLWLYKCSSVKQTAHLDNSLRWVISIRAGTWRADGWVSRSSNTLAANIVSAFWTWM